MRRVVVTGAGGFIGATLVRRLLEGARADGVLEKLTAVDLHLDHLPEDPRLERVTGSVADPELLARVCAEPIDVVFHLASVPGGAAERDHALGRRINLDATAAWLEALGQHAECPRFVYASSVAVYGEPLPERVDEHTPTTPSLSYGAHKLICEILVADATRRGWVQGCSLRLPGIVSRPSQDAGLMSSFMSEVFRALEQGRPVALPVRPDGTAWWLSTKACVENLIHAASVDPKKLRASRAYPMPALWLSMQCVVDGLLRRFGEDRRNLVSFAPVPLVQRLFASYPPLAAPEAESLGFRHDQTVERLIEAALF